VLRGQAEDYVARFTGKDTLVQMEAFARHVRALGGSPRSPADYKSEFLDRINHARDARVAALQQGTIRSDDLMVPGSRALLDSLYAAGIPIFLASGTAHEVVAEEAELLDIERYFDGIYGSAPANFTKRELLAHLVSNGIPAGRILTFGDGRVEIEDTREIGGVAVGVATDEPDCVEVDAKKRLWLSHAGADFIIPNYLEEDLLGVLGIV
jgi:phosphoglycolate phosphatase-like HAD superfamily hydrolase